MEHVTNVAFLVFGLLVGGLALIGVLSAVRDTPLESVRALGDDQPPAVTDPLFMETVELLSRTALQPGHHIEVLSCGDETYPGLWDDLRAARHSITIQQYYCKPGRMADTLQEILAARAGEGVSVFFLYDAFGSSLPRQYFAELRRAGVKTAAFRPLKLTALNKVHHRSHIRVVVVDGRVGYTGGFGIDDKWFGNGRQKDQWRDTNARFTGPAVRQLQATFATCWVEATGELFTGRLLFPDGGSEAAASEDGMLAGVLHATPSVGSTEAERFFALSIAGARKTLYITNSYFVPDRDFRRLIGDAARRGVDTRVLTTGAETDVRSTLYAGRARYEQLLVAGVRIYEYRPTMMHAKTLVVDGTWVSVGTMNADNRSLSFNEEVNLLALDSTLGASLDRLFFEDLQHADEVKLDEFRRRPWRQKLIERAAYGMWRVL
ncbi:MAG: phospholipase D-like domain-containing protein [Gemmatimonadota bacterium]|nr:phospholipase D-like domain-containing protein [Gemmatimonadota bacterium]